MTSVSYGYISEGKDNTADHVPEVSNFNPK